MSLFQTFDHYCINTVYYPSHPRDHWFVQTMGDEGLLGVF